MFRVLGFLLGVFCACLGLLSIGVSGQPAEAAERASGHGSRLFVRHIEFTYTGSMQGEEDFYGFISVAKPYGKTGHQSWEYEWAMRCQTEASIATPTAPVGCRGPVRISGWVKDTFTGPSLGQNCTGKITNVKGAQWSLGVNPRNRTTVLLQAGPPAAEIVITPTPRGSNCTGFDQAIRWGAGLWKQGPNISAPVRWDFPDHRRPGFASGEYVDSAHGNVVRGHVTTRSLADFKFHQTLP